jgi:alcohol dehydrogenase, propanol-preferring
MRAAVLRSPARADERPLRVEDVALPDPAAGELLVRVEACALCRTDLQLAEGDLGARRLPIVPGHQVVGRVDAVGPGVAADRVGARVGITWLAGTCGVCRFCRSGRENLCESATFTGWDRDGGLAGWVTARDDVVVDLPDGPGAPAAADLAPLLCAGVIGHRSLRVSGVEPGGRLGLVGFGASASIVIQLAVHRGIEVVVCTRSERERAVALDLGAAWVGDFDERPPIPVDGAITTAPVGDAVVHALRSLDRGGIVAVNAIHLDRVPEFPYEDLWWERQIRSVANVTRADAREFLAEAVDVPVRTRHVDRALEDAPEALVDLAAGRVDGSVVLVS